MGIDFDWCYSTDIPLIDLDSGETSDIFTISKNDEGINCAGYSSVCFMIDSAKLNGQTFKNNPNNSGYSIWSTEMSEEKLNVIEIYDLPSVPSFKYRIVTR